jgi:hypothetical protein
MSNKDFEFTKLNISGKVNKIGITLLVIGLALGVVSYIMDPARASFSYLLAYIFLLTVGMGSLFLVALEYAAGAVWSVFFRRISEFFASIIPILIILIIPLLFNLHDIFTWTHKSLISADKVIHGKASYLNIPFLLIRFGIILVIFSLFYKIITVNSRKQDATADQNLTTKNIKFSIAYIVFFAFAVTVLAIDWIMSIEPHWFSTIFGVYLFSGTTWVALAITTLVAVILKEKGQLPQVTKDHFYSLGTLMFAFTAFWGYIAFSQYMLMWIGNLPDETSWFFHRWTGPWTVISVVLIVTHFIVPFFALISYPSKTNYGRLKFISIWIIAAHLLDLYWLIMPGMRINGGTYFFSWSDLVFLIAAIGFLILVFASRAKKYNFIPIGDPKLQRSIDFKL